MDSRSAYRLQLMEKLGAPLLRALPGDVKGEKAAEAVAALIGKSVQAGLGLSQAMKLSDDDGDIDSIRLSLAALAAPLLADLYKESGKIPGDVGVDKVVKGLSAALVFSENFTAALETTARLKSLHDPLPVIDTAQISLLTLNALAPAVRAVQQFSFGQSGPALIKDIAGRLQQLAKELAAKTIEGDGDDQAYAGLLVLRALAELYAACHDAQVKNHKSEDSPQLDDVWAAFDQQAAMMLALAGAAVPGESAGDTTAPAAPEPPKQEKPSASAATPSSAGATGPMGFFKKPGDDVPAQTPQPPSPPVSAPPSGDETAPPPPAGNPGNPMSFFKSGGKKPPEDA